MKPAGTENGARIKITAGLVGWSDVIFVMEKKHADRIRGGDLVKLWPGAN